MSRFLAYFPTMGLQSLLEIPNTAVIFIAPPAWGKTRMLIEMIKNSQKTWVFVSPLRALAEEFYLVMTKITPTLKLSQVDSNRLSKGMFYICTPEVWISKNIEIDEEETIFIFDEIHLYPYWGESFRDRMLEAQIRIYTMRSSCLLLSATLSTENKVKIQEELNLNFDNQFQVDLGNQCLKYPPVKIIYYPFFISMMNKRILKASRRTTLIFVAYRDEVERYKRVLLGRDTLFCKGGEAQSFSQELSLRSKPPEFIVCTSVLSHGVNLPPIDRIFITYPLKNLDYWVQFVGRGGRRGESYELHTCDSFGLTHTQIILQSALHLLWALWYRLRRIYE
jgi:ATP-dependent DNA helicase RecQ